MKQLALFFALSAMSMSAMAQSATPNPVENPAAPASSATTTAQPAPKDEVAKKGDVSDRSCLKETGSRLAPRPDGKGRKCVNASGRSYTKGDLDSTGAIDLSDALRRLDPAVH
ncbi:MAG: hypothetical protein ACREO7_06490 [Pseudoxanthomonas sp.]